MLTPRRNDIARRFTLLELNVIDLHEKDAERGTKAATFVVGVLSFLPGLYATTVLVQVGSGKEWVDTPVERYVGKAPSRERERERERERLRPRRFLRERGNI